jgi:hypothetical protein
MAQAVAAQALARAGTLLRAPDVVAAARRAEATVPNLLLRVGGSPWVRIYAFNRETVLNAQLQTIVSLQDYAAATGDPAAQSLVSALISATTRLLPRFDTGYWSLYSLGGPEAPLEYHQYVVALLRILASRTRQPVLTTYAGRFRADLTQPPLVKGGAGPPPLYPWPADGFRDAARLVFWVSKRSTVTLNVAGAARATLLVPRAGWRVIVWRPRGIGTGTFATSLHAVDVAGNASDTDLPPLQIRRDTEPPTVDAALAGTRLSWTATDDATPWLRLTLSFNRLRAHRRLSLGRRRLRGSLRVSPPRGTWSVILIAADSSGNATRVPLGLTRGRGG